MAALETHDFQKQVKHSQRKDLCKVDAAASQDNSRTVPQQPSVMAVVCHMAEQATGESAWTHNGMSV